MKAERRKRKAAIIISHLSKHDPTIQLSSEINQRVFGEDLRNKPKLMQNEVLSFNLMPPTLIIKKKQANLDESLVSANEKSIIKVIEQVLKKEEQQKQKINNITKMDKLMKIDQGYVVEYISDIFKHILETQVLLFLI